MTSYQESHLSRQLGPRNLTEDGYATPTIPSGAPSVFYFADQKLTCVALVQSKDLRLRLDSNMTLTVLSVCSCGATCSARHKTQMMPRPFN